MLFWLSHLQNSYDRPRQRILVHGGLRRDKPSRLCAPSVFQLDVSNLAHPEEAAWFELETGSVAS